MKKVIFYGPLGGKKGTIIGGGESGNRKTISILSRNGFDVHVVEKPYPIAVPLIKILVYPVQIFLSYLHILVNFTTNRSKCSFHVSGFYNHLIYIEWILVKTARFFSVKTVYELRAGGAIEGYENRSNIYRYFFRDTVASASSVLCQGMDYLPFLKKIVGVDGLYYPNFIQSEHFKDYSGENRILDSYVQLVYFGRITPSKNIEFIIDICKRISHQHFACEIIGKGDKAYITQLNEYISKENLTNKITISPPIPSDNLFSALQKKHFFLFPSREKREGHSNSLTEAMAAGVVPIASDAGFNRTVIQDDSLIVDTYDPELYAATIDKILKDGLWKQYSQQCYQVVKNYYTETAVEPTLIAAHLR